MTTVAITGVNGLVGRRLLRALADHDEVTRVIGLDLALPVELDRPDVDLITADVRDASIAEHLRGADVVVHLAFMLNPSLDETTMYSVNVGGTRNVVTAAAATGAAKVIYLSSGVAYGAHPDNPFPLTEDAPRRANPDFNYAEHKAEVEGWLDDWQADGADGRDDLTVTVFRPAIILGPGVDNFITRQLQYPRLIGVRGHRPPWQFVHVDDVVAALVLAITSDLPGAYNLACEGWLSVDEVLAITGKRTSELPEEIAFATAARMWRRGLGLAPSGMLHYVMHPWVLSVDKLCATGWRPSRTNRDVLAEFASTHGDQITLPGGARVAKSTLRGATLASAAVAAATVTAIVRARRNRS